jgi:hypothetical protein
MIPMRTTPMLCLLIVVVAAAKGEEPNAASEAMAAFSKAQSAVGSIRASFKKLDAGTSSSLLSPDEVESTQGQLVSRLEDSEQFTSAAVVAFESHRTSQAYVKGALQKAQAQVAIDIAHAQHAAKREAEKMQENKDELAKLKLEAETDIGGNMVEAHLKAQAKGMRMALLRANREVRAAKSKFKTLEDKLLEAQDAAAKAMKEAADAKAVGATNLDEIQEVADTKDKLADSASAQADDAKHELEVTEEAESMEKGLTGGLQAMDKELVGLVSEVKDMGSTLDAQDRHMKALEMSIRMAVEETNDAKQKAAIEAAIEEANDYNNASD